MGHVVPSLAISDGSSIVRLDHIDISCDLLLGNTSVVEGGDSLDLIFIVPEFEFVTLSWIIEHIAASEFQFGLFPFVDDCHHWKFGPINDLANEYLG